MSRRYDVVVVGAGATGLWVARELALRGAEVLVLDAGARHPSAAPLLERPGASFADGDAAWQSRAAARAPVQSQCRLAFGPATEHLFADDSRCPYTLAEGASFTWIRARAVGGRLNLWSQICLRMSDFSGWPITLADLEPHYARVERFLGVEAQPLGTAELRLGERLGRPIRPRPQSTLPRGSEAQLLLAEAEATGRAVVAPHHVVSRVLRAPSGRAAGVTCADRGEILAGAVVLAASTIETVRILLSSGIGGGSGWLGRGLMDHVMAQPLLTAGVPASFGEASGHPFLLPSERYQLHGWLRPEPDRLLLAMYCQGEVAPQRENRVELDPQVQDFCGIQVPRIHFSYGDAERLIFARSLEAARAVVDIVQPEWHQLAEAWRTPGSSLHELGGARMGASPDTSVVDPVNAVWDAGNLFVVDGACFATAGSENPTLTMLALADRAVPHILTAA